MTNKPTATELAKQQEKAYESMYKWAKWLIENQKDDDCPQEHWLFGGKDER